MAFFLLYGMVSDCDIYHHSQMVLLLYFSCKYVESVGKYNADNVEKVKGC